MKIYNPERRSKFIWRDLHNICHKFVNVEAARSALYHELEDDVPDTGDFSIGYFEGKQQKKKWLSTTSDLEVMYALYDRKPQISLWCDGKSQAYDELSDEELLPNPPPSKKRKKKDTEQKLNEGENELESVFLKLKDKHGVEYSGPQLRLWARMIVAKTYDDVDTPPNVPMITGPEKSKRRESLSDALAGAAIAVTKAFSPPASENCSHMSQGNVSPSKKIDLRLKNLTQLQQLQDEGVLNQEEFLSQKKIVLMSLNNLV